MLLPIVATLYPTASDKDVQFVRGIINHSPALYIQLNIRNSRYMLNRMNVFEEQWPISMPPAEIWMKKLI